MKNQKVLHFIPDQPTTDDRLGTHESIAETIKDVILSDMPKPFVLGLFGRWGSGKSSIINILRKKCSKEIKFVFIDAWRKEKENFVQNFIKKIARKLLSGKKQKDVISKITEKVTIQKGGWRPNRVALFCFLIFLGLCAWLANFTYTSWKNDPLSTFPAGEFASLGLTVLIAIFFSLILPRYSMQFTNTVEDLTLDDPLRFRNIFIHEILNQTPHKNICIIVDNIDRTPPRDALNIIKVLKAFIVDADETEPSMQKVSFLIPCDNSELHNHLKSNGMENPKEFLRKFFNLSIRIPPLILNNSYRFSRDLLNDAELEYNDEQLRNIASVINAVLCDSPRQPKQFINQFIARLRLHKHVLSKLPTSEIIEDINKNPQWIAYFLVLQSEIGIELPDKIEDINNRLKDKVKDGVKDKESDLKNKKIVSSFLTRAGWAKPTSQAVWNQLLYLKTDEIFSKIPNFKNVYDSFVEQRFDDAQKLIKENKDIEQNEIFEELLKRSNDDPHVFSSITQSIFEILKRNT